MVITSDYTTVGIEPFTTKGRLADHNKIARSKGTIERVLYNKKKNGFYVIITADVEDEKQEGMYRPFVVQYYDDNFNLKEEKLFENGNYSPFIVYVVQGKLMLYKKNNDINSFKNGKQIFEFFTFN